MSRRPNRDLSTPFRMTSMFSGLYPSAISDRRMNSAFVKMQSARRHTSFCTRRCIGVQGSPVSLIDATMTGAAASRAAGTAKTLP